MVTWLSIWVWEISIFKKKKIHLFFYFRNCLVSSYPNSHDTSRLTLTGKRNAWSWLFNESLQMHPLSCVLSSQDLCSDPALALHCTQQQRKELNMFASINTNKRTLNNYILLCFLWPEAYNETSTFTLGPQTTWRRSSLRLRLRPALSLRPWNNQISSRPPLPLSPETCDNG